jgi:hypothetical protein
MAKKALVSPDLELGSEIVQALDEASFPFTVAMWSFNEEADDYELIIGTPLYDKDGLKESYRALSAALSKMDRNIVRELRTRILGNKNPLIRGLRRLFGKTASVEGMRLGGHTIGGVWLDDSYVYRIK